MQSKSMHVLPNPRGGWDIKNSGTISVGNHYSTKAKAVSTARSITKRNGSELVIHNKDGRIAAKDSHGRDSRTVKG